MYKVEVGSISGKIRYKLIESNAAIRLAIDLFVYKVIRTKPTSKRSGGGVEWRSGIDNRHKGSDDNPIIKMYHTLAVSYTHLTLPTILLV